MPSASAPVPGIISGPAHGAALASSFVSMAEEVTPRYHTTLSSVHLSLVFVIFLIVNNVPVEVGVQVSFEIQASADPVPEGL